MSKVKVCASMEDIRHLAALNGMDYCLMERQLMMDCPHWDYCSAVDCPLDLLQGHRGPEEDEKCRATRRVRQRIIELHREKGLIFALKYDGLTYKEHVREGRRAAGKARWEALSEEEKQARLARLPMKTKKDAVLVGEE